MEELDDGLLIYTNNANLVADSFLIDDLWEFSHERIGGNSNVCGGNYSNSHSESSLSSVLDSARCSYIAQPNSDILPLSTVEDGEMGLEWLSAFEEWSSVSDGAGNSGESQKKQPYQESENISETKPWSSSSMTMVIPCRARSKRTRLQIHPPKSLLSTTQESASQARSVEDEEEEKEEEEEEYEKKLKKIKRKGVKGKVKSVNGNSGQPRRCTHCQTQKTPQWRQGPLGPKSLCNACGVRFKTGRLYPEYRPAKSPSFVGFLHSNSHKKVLEMRTLCTGRGNDNGFEIDALPASMKYEPSFV